MKIKKVESLWSHIHWLVTLAATGGFTAAANRLGVSKAAMSHRIAELELAAGVALVRRTTRSVRLTEAGQQLVDATKSAFQEIERSLASVQDLVAEPAGLVRVTAPVALGRQQIVPRIPAFLRSHPQVRVELALSDRLSSLASEGLDLAIRHVESVPDTHVAWPLCESRTILAASRAYLRRHGTPANPEDLKRHNCLHYLRGGETPSWSFVPVEGSGSRLSVPIQGSFAANNSEALREMAIAGTGVALLPDFSAAQDLASGRLVAVLPHWRSVGAFGGQVYAIRPYSPHVPRAVQVLVEFLRASLSAGFMPASQVGKSSGRARDAHAPPTPGAGGQPA